MKKFYFHKPLLITLITAFLLMQWSAAHIHLAGEHKHDGEHHQHTATVHQHQLDNHHTDNIDPAVDILSHGDSHKVVELELECAQCKAKSAKQNASIQSACWDITEQHSLHSSLTHVFQAETYQSYFQYSSTRLRAPPKFS